MIKYLVNEVSIATEENVNFKGQYSNKFYGKGDKCVAHTGTHAEAVHDLEELNDWNIKEYGYDRMCDAVRNWTYKNPENSKWWKSTVCILKFEV